MPGGKAVGRGRIVAGESLFLRTDDRLRGADVVGAGRKARGGDQACDQERRGPDGERAGGKTSGYKAKPQGKHDLAPKWYLCALSYGRAAGEFRAAGGSVLSRSFYYGGPAPGL